MPKPREDRPTFPHLENLERTLIGLPDYLAKPVTVTEKIHGFNARVGMDFDGVVWVGTRSQDFDLLALDRGAIQGFRDYVVDSSIPDLLTRGMTVFGEWAGKGVQKGIDYGDKHFYVFGEQYAGSPVVSTVAALDQYWLAGIVTVPIIHEGRADLEVLEELRNGESIVAPGQPIEGVVVTPVSPIIDTYGHQVIAKFKSRRFSELTHVREARPIPDLSTVTAIAGEYVNFERLEHVLAKVREEVGDDPLEVRHTGVVLRTMFADVREDAGEAVSGLSKEDEKLLGKALNYATIPLLQAARDEAMREAVS